MSNGVGLAHEHGWVPRLKPRLGTAAEAAANRVSLQRQGRAASSLAGAAAMALLLCACASARPLAAQVGHDPQHSPFQDVTTRQTFTPFISEFFGNRAHAGVGSQAGPAFGARFTTALSGPLELWATFAMISSKRNVIDPSKPAATRLTGPVDMKLVSADLGIALRLTGARTFHGLEPYVGVAFGVVAPTRTVTDPGGFSANSNITFVPTIGTRARIGRFVSLTLEARDNLMRYEWPSAYFFPTDPNGVPITPPVLDPIAEKDKQMTHNFTLTAGLSFHFNF
ncbi:MAG: hypothetical protein ACHQU1_00520 [Gemmatimonadales bacterium]